MNRQTYKELTHEFRADERALSTDTFDGGMVLRSWLRKQMGHDKTLMHPMPGLAWWEFWTNQAAQERKRLQEVVAKAKHDGKLTQGVPLSVDGSLNRYKMAIARNLQNAREYLERQQVVA